MIATVVLVGLTGCSKPDLSAQEKIQAQQRAELDKMKQEIQNQKAKQ